MRYENFDLQIKPGASGAYTVYVRSPAGETEGRLDLAAGGGDLRHVVRSGPRAAGDGEGRASRELSPGPDEPAAAERRDVGSRLFDALFGGRVEALFHESLALLEPAEGLRLRLLLDLSDRRLLPIAALPWELLYSRRLGGFLAIRRRTPVVRHVEVARPAGPRPLPETLRILVAIASPEGLPPLDLGTERERLEATWSDLGGVEVECLEAVSREELGNTLRDGVARGRPHHVLHFMGHGRSDPATGEGEVVFSGDDGAARPVRGEELASELADFPELRFVFLNACQTGGLAEDSRSGAAHVAAALVRTGVQAVVAMRDPISDRAAIELSRVLYARIAAGDPLDTAMTEGRLALDRRADTAAEWSIPVLFLRLPDARLFEPEPPPRARRILAAAALLAILFLAVAAHVATRRTDPCAEDPSPRARALVEAADRAAGAGRHDESSQRLREAIELEPRYATAYSALGFVEMERGRYGAARESLARAERELPRCALHVYNLGSFHLFRQEYEQAVQSLRRALEIDPDLTAASAALGRAHFLLGSYPAARGVLEEGLRRAERREPPPTGDVVSSLHANLGRIALATGAADEAIGRLGRALALLPLDDPRRRDLVTSLAEARSAVGQEEAACGELATLLPLLREPLVAWERRATDLARDLQCSSAEPIPELSS